ncbi:MAG: sodium:proline symporter [Candidatus Marinimicrobia bacterium]|nr:sodium:proline symporter [Candidatus Neomarinimicrobiota bacterium]|tara:strand:- start:14800 stop:16224 length:1425 start_codon:yes stop_codon:yes gene_type:complete
MTIGFFIYFTIILLVGIITSRYNKTMPDFLLAGRRLGPWVVAFSERASGQSGWLLLGLTGLAYSTGLGDPSGLRPQPALWASLGGCLGVVLSWILIAKKLRVESEKLGALTLGRFFELKFRGYDPQIRFVTTGIIVFCFIFYIAAQFDAAGKSLEQTFGVHHLTGMIVGASIIVFYTLLGGFFAVAWTDFVQGIIMLVTLVLLPLIALNEVGGLDTLIQKVSSIDKRLVAPSGERSGWTLISGIIGGLGIGLGYLGQPHVLTRYMSIRSISEVNKAKWVAIIYAFLTYLGAILMGIVAIAYFGPGFFADPEKMMPALATSIFPAWFSGIVICGALAAMMSTADSQLLVITSSVAEDIYHHSFNQNASQVRLVLLSRIVTVLIGLIAIFLARLPSSIFDKVLFAWGGLGAALGPPLLLSLWWKNTSRNGVFYGMIIGIFSVIIWENYFKWTGLYSLLPGFFLSFFTIYLISQKNS